MIKLRGFYTDQDRLCYNGKDLDLRLEEQRNGKFRFIDYSGAIEPVSEPMTMEQADDIMKIIKVALENYTYPTNLGG